MNKDNQSLLDFLQTLPLSSFTMRSPISNKEAQTLYDIWIHGEKDEYGKHVIPADADVYTVTSLSSKNYISNTPSRFATRDLMPVQACEFTRKGKDVIQKIILHKEKSSFEKSSHVIDYETIWRAAEAGGGSGKTASAKKKPQNFNWFERTIDNELRKHSQQQIPNEGVQSSGMSYCNKCGRDTEQENNGMTSWCSNCGSLVQPRRSPDKDMRGSGMF